MTIHIEDLSFACIIGILDFERTTPQDIILAIEITYEYNDTFINYADVRDAAKLYMINSEFLLLEDALAGLSKKLKEKFSTIDTLSIKITKPSILSDCTVSVSNFYSFSS
ncbi:MAG: dihydroneopterin aldolase [Sulfurimonas sp.]|nr:dihydroneopterin aldolase [Sulfurimonas sp.]